MDALIENPRLCSAFTCRDYLMNIWVFILSTELKRPDARSGTELFAISLLIHFLFHLFKMAIEPIAKYL